MLGEEVAAAGFAPFAMTALRLVVSTDVVSAPRDLDRFGFPKREGVDRPRRPAAARIAMAITHAGRLAAHGELDRAAKTTAFVSLSVVHDAPPWCCAVADLSRVLVFPSW
jgi:hypothetical protein